MNFVDPTGENPWLVRFAIGALAGIAEEMLFEMWDNFQNGRPWDCFDWGQIGLAGLFGGLTSAGLGGLGAKIGGKLKGLLEQWVQGRAENSLVQFAQKTISSKFKHGKFAGRTLDDVVSGLLNGAINPDELPINIITRNGVTYTFNNRSLMALRMAGKEPTIINDCTGISWMERKLTERLKEIGSDVGSDFLPFIRP